MERFPDDAAFKFPWRDYQQKVLSSLANHLQDDHLHVVAPPGSGKTVLGLEVMRQLNAPTLICAPSLALRDQWVLRFCELFLDTPHRPSWLSVDIKAPGFLTVTTYQAVHAALGDDEQSAVEAPVLSALCERGVATLVLDEAHHLKNAWWRALTLIKTALSPKVVALTATPPYDVTGAEWERYLSLNGEVDAEIAVPDLVARGDLCAHQDYVYFSNPTEKEAALLQRSVTQRRALAERMLADGPLLPWLASQSWMVQPLQQLDWIYEHFPLYLAALCFSEAAGQTLDEAHHTLLDNENIGLPTFAPVHLTCLLQTFLSDSRSDLKAAQTELEGQLKRAGLFHRGRVDLEDLARRQKLLGSSAGKMASVAALVAAEWKSQGRALRQVILADFIRAEYLGAAADEEAQHAFKLGVVPLFEVLRTRVFTPEFAEPPLAVLTGQLVILPARLAPRLDQLALAAGVSPPNVSPLPFDARFVQLAVTGGQAKYTVQWLTALFESGDLRVMIGTAALLGEGWDAPSISSLIIASGVGSFVQSNQMRGRAIRAKPGDAQKTANIWHLACVDPQALLEPADSAAFGTDVTLLARRFDAFVGLTLAGDARIESGFSRVQLAELIADRKNIQAMNQAMLAVATDRPRMRERWRQALASGSELVQGIKVPYASDRSYAADKRFALTQSLRTFLFSMLTLLVIWLDILPYLLARAMPHAKTLEQLLTFGGVLLLIGVCYFGWQAIYYVRLWLAYRDIGDDLHNIGKALLATLCDTGRINNNPGGIALDCAVNEFGQTCLTLRGANRFEQSLFVQMMSEIVDVVDNPRYMLIRQSRLFDRINQYDYHAVPEQLGVRKALAQQFADAWRDRVGRCELVYTRTLEGRQRLHKARVASLAYQLQQARVSRERFWM